MFRDTRRKKRRERLILASLGIMVMAFGLWLNFKEPAGDEPVQSADSRIEADADRMNDDNDMKAAAEGADKIDENDENSGETSTEIQYESYLIKEVNGVVKVFLCDKSGKKELYLITSIPFELLSETDQELFREGVSVETKDDLGKFLENFDS